MTITPDDLRKEARKRYPPGRGPYSKESDLDQVDLAWLENLASHYAIYSDPKGMLSGCVTRLTEEVRRARGWPQPKRDEWNVMVDYPWPPPEQ